MAQQPAVDSQAAWIDDFDSGKRPRHHPVQETEPVPEDGAPHPLPKYCGSLAEFLQATGLEIIFVHYNLLTCQSCVVLKWNSRSLLCYDIAE